MNRLWRRNEVLRALHILREIAPLARGRLRDPIRSAFTQAATQQQQREAAALLVAHQQQREHPDDLDRQRQAWQDFLTIADPTSEAFRQAQVAITALEQRFQRSEREQQVTTALAAARRNLRTAQQSRTISTVQQVVAQVEALQSPLLSTSLADQVTELLIEANQLLAQLKTDTGQVTTLLESGDREAAYHEAQKWADLGLPEVWDTKLNRTRPTGDVLRDAAQQLSEFRKTKALERLQRAQRAIANGTPAQAVAYYTEAVAFLTFLTLTSETRDGSTYITGGTGRLPRIGGQDPLEHERATLEEALDTGRELLDLWRNGNTLFQQAEREPDPEKALGLLRAAKATTARHPDLRYPGLDEAIRRREEDLSMLLAVLVDNARTDAEAAADRHDFAQALQRLTAARARASTVQQSSTRLAQALTQVEADIQTVRAQQRRAREVQNTLLAAHAALNAIPPDLEHARLQLADLSEAERRGPDVIEVQRRIASLQSTQENWNLAQAAYQEANWTVVVETCAYLIQRGGTVGSAAESLSGRARAMLALETARQARNSHPPTFAEARQAYNEALALFTQYGTDAATQAAQHEAQHASQELVALVQADQRIAPELAAITQQLRTTEQAAAADRDAHPVSLAPRPAWGQLVTRLQALLDQPSSLTAALEATHAQVVDHWRDDYLGRVRRAPRTASTLGPLTRLIKEVQEAGLLWDPADQRLAIEIEINYTWQHVEELRAQARPRWDTIVALEHRMVELAKLGYLPDVVDNITEVVLADRLHSAQCAQIQSTVQMMLATQGGGGGGVPGATITQRGVHRRCCA